MLVVWTIDFVSYLSDLPGVSLSMYISYALYFCIGYAAAKYLE